MYPSDQALSKVRDFIETRNFALDGRIPPERTLAAELGVGRRSTSGAGCARTRRRIHRQQGRGFSSIRAARQRPAPIISAPNSIERGPARLSLSAALDSTCWIKPIPGSDRGRLATEPVMAPGSSRASQSEISACRLWRPKPALPATPKPAGDGSLFHRTIAEAARNTLFLAFFDTMRANRHDAGWRPPERKRALLQRQSVYAGFHGSVFAAAIAARNGHEAYAQMQRHLGDDAAVHPEQTSRRPTRLNRLPLIGSADYRPRPNSEPISCPRPMSSITSSSAPVQPAVSSQSPGAGTRMFRSLLLEAGGWTATLDPYPLGLEQITTKTAARLELLPASLKRMSAAGGRMRARQGGRRLLSTNTAAMCANRTNQDYTLIGLTIPECNPDMAGFQGA